MKNYDLVWARERTGWTQEQAARKMDVRRRTFSRWETGAVSMPNRKWQAFLKLAQLKEHDIPPQRKYDDRGFPVGFNKESYWVEGDFDTVREEAALREIEGEEHASRARERYRLLTTHLCKGAPDSAEKVRQDMAEYDEMADPYGGPVWEVLQGLRAQGLKEIPKDELIARACESPLWTKRESFDQAVNCKRTIQYVEDIGRIVIRAGRLFPANQPWSALEKKLPGRHDKPSTKEATNAVLRSLHAPL